MKKFIVLLSAVTVLGGLIQAWGDGNTVGTGKLAFRTLPDCTVLTPIVLFQDTNFGYYNLLGNPINADGSPRTASPGAPSQDQIIEALALQYAVTPDGTVNVDLLPPAP